MVVLPQGKVRQRAAGQTTVNGTNLSQHPQRNKPARAHGTHGNATRCPQDRGLWWSVQLEMLTRVVSCHPIQRVYILPRKLSRCCRVGGRPPGIGRARSHREATSCTRQECDRKSIGRARTPLLPLPFLPLVFSGLSSAKKHRRRCDTIRHSSWMLGPVLH